MPSTKDLSQADATIGALEASAPRLDARLLGSQDPAVRRSIVASVRDACAAPGFFFLERVFADPSIYINVQQQMRRFFSLPDDDPVKQAVRAEGSDSLGWTPLHQEPAYQPGTVAHMEAFDCGVDDTANTWPELADFRRDVIRYREALTSTADAVFELLAEAAGIERGFFVDRCRTQSLNTLRLIHYPEDDLPDSATDVGISAHTDFECITFISQTAPGLELTDVAGNWYDAPSDDRQIVVLLGDMLERWTNGHYKATGHRVRNTPQRRYSTVIFFAVDEDVVIEPLPRFVGRTKPPQFGPTTQAAHIDA
ncbi:MAG: hypothetical protein MI865_05935, partial [Proteobacteria bacterium]|nr:hypothetical protein [Pseudomonadota bacterium]